MERCLSDESICELQQDDDKTTRFFRSCIRRGKMHKVETRKKDRRVAMNSCVSPEMERRSGYDRRR
jgi:hypothetical protein